jgi:hypothetical protein
MTVARRGSLCRQLFIQHDPARLTAKFFDPGYVMQCLGFDYSKLHRFSTRLGFAAQEIFANKYCQYSDNKAFELETG